MVTNCSNPLRTYALVVISAAALAASACGGSTELSPTAPSSSLSNNGTLTIAISPNPVPWSSEPAPNCNLANRWQYQQTLRNTGGTGLTISDRVDFFDGVEVSKRSGLGIVLPPGADAAITTHWCSGNNVAHRTQTNFSGSDDNGNPIAVIGPIVRLQPK
ncbi:MAG: hypothetical protein ACRD3C_02510 [Vicinamibacterales bacterium]